MPHSTRPCPALSPSCRAYPPVACCLRLPPPCTPSLPSVPARPPVSRHGPFWVPQPCTPVCPALQSRTGASRRASRAALRQVTAPARGGDLHTWDQSRWRHTSSKPPAPPHTRVSQHQNRDKHRRYRDQPGRYRDELGRAASAAACRGAAGPLGREGPAGPLASGEGPPQHPSPPLQRRD